MNNDVPQILISKALIGIQADESGNKRIDLDRF